MNKKKLQVLGMSCQHCVNRVTKIINGFDGVSNAEVSLEGKEATFHYDPLKIDIRSIINAIVDAGYQASEL